MRNLFASAALAISILAAAPLQAEVIKSDEGGFVTRDTAVVDATPMEVWLALISPGKWWNSDHTWSGDAANMTLMPKAGGCFCERIPEANDADRVTLEGSVEHMRVIQAYPERALRLTGALGPLQSEPVGGVLTIAIGEAEKGTRIVWEYAVGGYMRFPVDTIAPAVDGVMSQQLNGLASLLGRIDAADPASVEPSQEPGEPGEASVEDAIDAMANKLPQMRRLGLLAFDLGALQV